MKAGVDYIGITTSFYCTDGNGNILMAKRSQNCRDEQGSWEPGGGQLELGLTPEENVLKEVFEEYGCKGEIIANLQPLTLFRDNNGVQTHWLAFPFFIKINPKEVKNGEPKSIDELGWFKLDNLPTPLHKGFQKIYNQHLDEFAKYI